MILSETKKVLLKSIKKKNEFLRNKISVRKKRMFSIKYKKFQINLGGLCIHKILPKIRAEMLKLSINEMHKIKDNIGTWIGR